MDDNPFSHAQTSSREIVHDARFARASDRARAWIERTFGPDRRPATRAWPRFAFLRVMGLMHLSVFASLAAQIHGLIGPRGVRPAGALLAALTGAHPGVARFWMAPSLLWIDASDRALTALVVAGAAASLLVTLDVAPRASLACAGAAFLSFVTTAREFSEYQSDGMLLEATAIAIALAPRGLRPGLARDQPPSRAAVFLLVWEWFRIYFESGVAKIASGDPTWRDLTAMDHYYENGPLPTWIGWYAQHLPHGFHAATALATLVIELGVVFLGLSPNRRARLAAFVIVTPLQIGIIATSNYAFLNYLVLALGVLLLNDAPFERAAARLRRLVRAPGRRSAPAAEAHGDPAETAPGATAPRLARRTIAEAFALSWIFYATCAGPLLAGADEPMAALAAPARAIEPLRVANTYGLFAVMTPARYEIEFQGSNDGATWVAYPFRFKPQDVGEAPGIYAPYQPRFEWNLWFSSLGSWRDNTWVVSAEAALARGEPPVLRLFRRDPFGGAPPRFVRTMVSQYWFTDLATKRATGAWWRRETIAPYAPAVERRADGVVVVEGTRPGE